MDGALCRTENPRAKRNGRQGPQRLRQRPDDGDDPRPQQKKARAGDGEDGSCGPCLTEALTTDALGHILSVLLDMGRCADIVRLAASCRLLASIASDMVVRPAKCGSLRGVMRAYGMESVPLVDAARAASEQALALRCWRLGATMPMADDPDFALRMENRPVDDDPNISDRDWVRKTRDIRPMGSMGETSLFSSSAGHRCGPSTMSLYGRTVRNVVGQAQVLGCDVPFERSNSKDVFGPMRAMCYACAVRRVVVGVVTAGLRRLGHGGDIDADRAVALFVRALSPRFFHTVAGCRHGWYVRVYAVVGCISGVSPPIHAPI